MREITNSDDLFDSQEVVARIAELGATDEREDWEDDELTALKALVEQAKGTSGWDYGATFIRDRSRN